MVSNMVVMMDVVVRKMPALPLSAAVNMLVRVLVGDMTRLAMGHVVCSFRFTFPLPVHLYLPSLLPLPSLSLPSPFSLSYSPLSLCVLPSLYPPAN